jgi:hypothetical protein
MMMMMMMIMMINSIQALNRKGATVAKLLSKQLEEDRDWRNSKSDECQ